MKNLLILAPLLLIFSSSYGQNPDLFVRPNPANLTDSFIYANDVVIYVENGIGLEVNTNNPDVTRASMYLRGDSQLIQGDKPSSLNFGDGHLSIWQWGYANAFDYNYWASPIGNPNDPLDGNTRFGIPRIFDVRAGAPGQLHKTRSTQQQTIGTLNGVPSDGATPAMDGNLRVSSRWIYTLRNSNNYTSWIHISNQNGLNGSGLAPGEGFTMKGTGTFAQVGHAHNQLYDFRGRPNDGDITIEVAHSGTEGLSRLVGNPYPSALDLAAFLQENTAIRGEILYWDQDRTTNSHYIADYQGGYGVWIPIGGEDIDPLDPTQGTSGEYTVPVFGMYDGSGAPVTTPIPGNGIHKERRFAPVGQGFVVVGNESLSVDGAPGNGTITFKNSMRRHVALGATNFSQFRSNSLNVSKSISSNSKSKIEGTLRFHINVDNTYTRDMVLMFSKHSTNGLDRGFDGRHPSVIQSGDAFWKIEQRNEPYVIQTRPYDFDSKVPIGFRVKNGQNTFKVNLVEMKGFEYLKNFNLFLYDALQNTYQKMDIGTPAVVYHSGNAGLIENRYYLVFRRGHGKGPGSRERQDSIISLASVEFFQNNQLSKLQITNPDMLDIKNAAVYDMRGRLVITQNNIGQVPQYEFSTQNLSSGIYLVMLTTNDNQVIDYKITIHNKN